MGARRKGRELALQMLYQWDVARQPISEVIGSISELKSPGEAAREFAKDLVRGTLSHLEEIDGLIAEHSENWRLSRMSTVDRNLIRLAVYEFMAGRTPKSVVINEAVEIAKRFSSPESATFVNGLLDAVCSRLETATATPRGSDES